MLDPAPLRDSLERWIDWLTLHRNVRRREIEAVCVVATSLASGAPVAFVETRGRAPSSRGGERLRYVRVLLNGEHVRASAAIPMLFPPVEVTTPVRAAGHYIDGGTRLNSPVSPALALGADRVIVIGFEPFAGRPDLPERTGPPRLADVAANILDGLLVDQVSDDLHRLAAINSFFVDAQVPRRSAYRKIRYALVAPERRGELGRLAEEIFDRRYAGWKGLLRPDYPLLSRLLGGSRTPSRGELLSFLLFDEAYVEALIEAGRRDAQRWLDRHPRFWCSDAAHDLDIEEDHLAAAHETAAIDEWRALRRR
jgi:NTE family protein